MPPAIPTVNDLVSEVTTATMNFALSTSNLPVNATASDLADAVAALDDAVARLRRHVIIHPESTIELLPSSEPSARDEIARLAELGIPDRTPVALAVDLRPDVDGRGDAALALSKLQGALAVFVWNPQLRRGEVDLTNAARTVLDEFDPFGDEEGIWPGEVRQIEEHDDED